MKTIAIAGETFWDISDLVSPDRYVRPTTRALVLHHTVGQTVAEDRNRSGTYRDEQIAHIQAIESFHRQKGYGGFGYQAIAFLTGDVYVVGPGDGARAHVAGQNAYYEGIALAGDWSQGPLPLGLVLGVARWVYAKWRQRGFLPVLGHREVPEQETSCPGDGTLRARPQLLRTVEAYAEGRRQELEEQVRKALAAALGPTALRGDLEELARQLSWLTGGRLCGR